MWFISSVQALLVPSNAEPVLALHWVNGVCKLFLYGPTQYSMLRIWLCLHNYYSLYFILNPHVKEICLNTAYWTCFLKMH